MPGGPLYAVIPCTLQRVCMSPCQGLPWTHPLESGLACRCWGCSVGSWGEDKQQRCWGATWACIRQSTRIAAPEQPQAHRYCCTCFGLVLALICFARTLRRLPALTHHGWNPLQGAGFGQPAGRKGGADVLAALLVVARVLRPAPPLHTTAPACVALGSSRDGGGLVGRPQQGQLRRGGVLALPGTLRLAPEAG